MLQHRVLPRPVLGRVHRATELSWLNLAEMFNTCFRLSAQDRNVIEDHRNCEGLYQHSVFLQKRWQLAGAKTFIGTTKLKPVYLLYYIYLGRLLKIRPLTLCGNPALKNLLAVTSEFGLWRLSVSRLVESRCAKRNEDVDRDDCSVVESGNRRLRHRPPEGEEPAPSLQGALRGEDELGLDQAGSRLGRSLRPLPLRGAPEDLGRRRHGRRHRRSRRRLLDERRRRNLDEKVGINAKKHSGSPHFQCKVFFS